MQKCILEIVQSGVFSTKNPIIMAVIVRDGILKNGHPIRVICNKLYLGKVKSIQKENTNVTSAIIGDYIIITVENNFGQYPIYNKQYSVNDFLETFL